VNDGRPSCRSFGHCRGWSSHKNRMRREDIRSLEEDYASCLVEVKIALVPKYFPSKHQHREPAFASHAGPLGRNNTLFHGTATGSDGEVDSTTYRQPGFPCDPRKITKYGSTHRTAAETVDGLGPFRKFAAAGRCRGQHHHVAGNTQLVWNLKE